MSDYIFLFDLDSTVTHAEILPTIAASINKGDEMRNLTERAMVENIPFKQNFLQRVALLQDIPVSVASEIIRNIPLNKQLVSFIQENKDRCYIVTGNLDVWIHPLMKDLGMERNYFSSKAIANNDKLERVVATVDKNAVISQFLSPFVAVGDGNNDAEMIAQATVGIGFGGVRRIAPSVLNCATHAIYKEETLCRLLKRLL